MVKCVVCGKKETFFEPAKGVIKNVGDTISVEMDEDTLSEKAFQSVDIDFNNKLYMGFSCSPKCTSVFDATPTAFVSNMHMVADYNQKTDEKKYNF